LIRFAILCRHDVRVELDEVQRGPRHPLAGDVTHHLRGGKDPSRRPGFDDPADGKIPPEERDLVADAVLSRPGQTIIDDQFTCLIQHLVRNLIGLVAAALVFLQASNVCFELVVLVEKPPLHQGMTL